MGVFNRRSPRIKPLLDLHCTWKSAYSTYPEVISVAMRDGRVVRYVIDAKPVHLRLGIDGWDTGKHQTIGYKAKKDRRSK